MSHEWLRNWELSWELKFELQAEPNRVTNASWGGMMGKVRQA